MGARVVLLCRRKEDGEAAAREIAGEAPVTPDVVAADLSSQVSIRQAAGYIRGRYSSLHVLINNAGVIPPRRELTVDGLEMQFAVNHLAYFLLTNLLLPQLKAGSPSRIINVSSGVHTHATIDFDDLQAQRNYQPKSVYSRSKLANILFTYELSRRLAGTGVTANCLSPGVVATKMLADYMGVPVAGPTLTSTFGATPEEGAETSIYLASSPEVESVTGKYFERSQPVASSRESHDEAVARRLWEVSGRLTGLSP
jgi:NAD(P)-dependent dehydrogenase (short-subunit alcohol dehydrogenase family)